MILKGSACQHMITIDEQLALSTQPLAHAAGEKPLPDNFLDSTSVFAISDAFKQFAFPLTGEIQPLFDYKKLANNLDAT